MHVILGMALASGRRIVYWKTESECVVEEKDGTPA